VKIYHWPGPSRFPVQGVSPNITLSEIPPNFMARYYSFPSLEKMMQQSSRSEKVKSLRADGF